MQEIKLIECLRDALQGRKYRTEFILATKNRTIALEINLLPLENNISIKYILIEKLNSFNIQDHVTKNLKSP
jgi:hypothetical protein